MTYYICILRGSLQELADKTDAGSNFLEGRRLLLQVFLLKNEACR